MKEIKIEKLIVNCCVGEAGDRVTRAGKVLEQLTGQRPVYSQGIFWFLISIFMSKRCSFDHDLHFSLF